MNLDNLPIPPNGNKFTVLIWDLWLLVKQQGLSFILIGLMAYNTHQKNAALEAKVDDLYRNLIEQYHNDSEKTREAIKNQADSFRELANKIK